jgi:hypothetical protein
MSLDLGVGDKDQDPAIYPCRYRTLLPEMDPGELKIAAIDSSVGEELTRYSKEFREIYFP